MCAGGINNQKYFYDGFNANVSFFQVLMCKDYVLIKGYPGTGRIMPY